MFTEVEKQTFGIKGWNQNDAYDITKGVQSSEMCTGKLFSIITQLFTPVYDVDIDMSMEDSANNRELKQLPMPIGGG